MRPAAPAPEAVALRLWLRMLACTNQVEACIRSRLRMEFGTTLPRFDMLAQLEAAGDGLGLTMSELSHRLMVTNGNITGLAGRLVREKLVTRSVAPHDRRSQRLRLTRAGRRALLQMAAEHRRWIEHMFAGVTREHLEQLYAAMGELRTSVQEAADDPL